MTNTSYPPANCNKNCRLNSRCHVKVQGADLEHKTAEQVYQAMLARTTADGFSHAIKREEQKPDCLITNKGVGIGTVEIKPLNTSKELIDTNIYKVAEICKRQLHIRMKEAITIKELCTFGMIVSGSNQTKFSKQEEDELEPLFDKYHYLIEPTIELKDDKSSSFQE